MNILIIEDEKKLAQTLEQGLLRQGHSISLEYHGEIGYQQAIDKNFDLVLLDIMLPGMDGFELLKKLRHQSINTPVLVLSARDALEDRIHGLDIGADDYLVKPFALAELYARIRAFERRRNDESLDTEISLNELSLDLLQRQASIGEQSIELTQREFDLLKYLVLNKNQIVTRDMIAQQIWNNKQRATPLDNVIDVHIAHLRKKIDSRIEKPLIHTVRGIGFIVRSVDDE